MAVSPYEWNESIRQRNEYIEERLKEGSPVVGISYTGGMLLLCLRGSQRKIFEVYDRLMFSAIGNQADIEAIRTGAIDVAHREGFTRSPEDVSIQRIVGFAISPSIKKVYSDAFAAPIAIRALFVELGKTSERDHFFVVGYDGEFSSSSTNAVIAGTLDAEEKALAYLKEKTNKTTPELNTALALAIHAWGLGRMVIDKPVDAESDEVPKETEADVSAYVGGLLKDGAWQLEAAVLERDTPRESKFRMLTQAELADVLTPLQ